MPKATHHPAAALDPKLEQVLYAVSISSAELAELPSRQVEHLLRYIEACPTGKHNRDIAERIERAIARMRASERPPYHERYRRARDPYMPPLEVAPGSKLPD